MAAPTNTSPPVSAGPLKAAFGALEGVALALPTTLGGVLLVYVHVGDAYLGSGMLAAMLGMVLVHLATLPSQRPMVFSARLFEATTLAAMLSQLPALLRGWGIPDSPETRLGFLILVVVLSNAISVAMYLLRADRLIRFIPTPVFQGFANSIALLLLISQAKTLWSLVGANHDRFALVVVLVTAVLVMLVVRRRLPFLPSAAVGLGAGALAGYGLGGAGHLSSMLAAPSQALQLPVFQAHFGFLIEVPQATVQVVSLLVSNALILGVMSFINHNVAVAAIAQAGGRSEGGIVDRMLPAFSGLASGAIGSLPLIASLQAAMGASRLRPLDAWTVFWCAVVWALVLALNLPLWMPVAAVSGVMMADAFNIFDRPSVAYLWRWLRRRRLSANAREDLALVAGVTLTAVLFNMVAAVVVGLFLGLLLFAVRNARKPLRQVWTGAQVRSNCARSRRERDVLERDGAHLKVFELEGDLFFGAASVLDEALSPHLRNTRVAVIDWSAVRHLDTSTALMVKKLARRLAADNKVLLHAGVRVGGPVADALAEQGVQDPTFPDLDRALETAENLMVASSPAGEPDGVTGDEAAGLLRGLEGDDAQAVLALMERQRFSDGEHVFEAGDTGRDLILVLSGSANVLVRTATGQELRLAAVRPGTLLGEVGFLDGAPRSATVRARGALEIARLARADFERFGAGRPDLAQRLLSNIAVDLAARLRSTNALLTARNRPV